MIFNGLKSSLFGNLGRAIESLKKQIKLKIFFILKIHNQHIISFMESNRQLTYEEKKDNYLKFPLRIVLDSVLDRQNVGMMFRISDALCVEWVHLCADSPTPPSKLISRTARSADRHVPYSYHEKVDDCIQLLKNQGFTVVALEITNQSKAIETVDFKAMGKVALVVGSEQRGVSSIALSQVDLSAHIPMNGIGFSMNVACSLSVALYEIVSQFKKK